MAALDSKLYRIKIIPGQEEVAKEWLTFLKENQTAALETLRNEHVYLETYFTATEPDGMYVYLFMAARSIEEANQIAAKSTNPLDLKHFDYGKRCVERTAGAIMDAFCVLDNLEGRS